MMEKPVVERQLKVATCEEVTKEEYLISGLKRLVKADIAPHDRFYRHLVHIVCCSECRRRIQEQVPELSLRICKHGEGLDLGTVCVHPV